MYRWAACAGSPAAWNVNGGYTRIFQTSMQALNFGGRFFEKDKDREGNKCILDNMLKLFSYAISNLWLWQRQWDDHMVSSWHPLVLIHLPVLARIPNLKITNNFKICSHLQFTASSLPCRTSHFFLTFSEVHPLAYVWGKENKTKPTESFGVFIILCTIEKLGSIMLMHLVTSKHKLEFFFF